MLENIGIEVKERCPKLQEFVSKIKVDLVAHPTATHNRSEELMRCVFEFGGLLPS